MSSLAVICESSSRVELAKEISRRLDAPFFLGVVLGSFDFLVAVTSERVELRSGRKETGPVFVDFVGGALNFRLKKSQGPDLLIRAIGKVGTGERLDTARRHRVLDLTAGLNSDAFVLAGHGCEVVAVERSQVLGCLVEDALRRGLNDEKIRETCQRLQFYVAESADFLKTVEAGEFDVVYLDPMFPEKKKTSLPKKELQVLQDLIGLGDEDESRSLLTKAGRKARRVVVKRPVTAPELLSGVSSSIEGRSVRFDIYIFS